VFTTGGRSEKFAMRQLPNSKKACFVQMGDFVKAAFLTAIKQKMQHIFVGAMVGKLTKMCQGLAVTHAWKAEIDRDVLAESAQAVGAPPDLVEAIRHAETGRFAAERLATLGAAKPFIGRWPFAPCAVSRPAIPVAIIDRPGLRFRRPFHCSCGGK
jgi:cobalt-precorrin-5B (C1)-methyltransferase